MYEINTVEQLRDLYGFPKGRAKTKILSQLEKHSIRFINSSPFVVIASYSKSGQVDCSPKGGEKGFVKVVDNSTLLIPESKGNNRLDGLTNFIARPSIGCLFLIPGMNETLRINGRVRLSQNPDFLKRFDHFKNKPKLVSVIKIEEVFLHCAKALMRSKLWSKDDQIERNFFPPMGKMLNDQIGLNHPVESQDEMEGRYHKDL